MIEFVLMVNKQGQTRLSSYYSWLSMEERVALKVKLFVNVYQETNCNVHLWSIDNTVLYIDDMHHCFL